MPFFVSKCKTENSGNRTVDYKTPKDREKRTFCPSEGEISPSTHQNTISNIQNGTSDRPFSHSDRENILSNSQICIS